ncbi:MAG: hypothetical protein ACTSU4_00820 [Promethearchaeota archaeon]
MTNGYEYTVEEDKIKKYLKLSTKQKLEWLEEINKLTDLVLTPKQKEVRNKFRSGEI